MQEYLQAFTGLRFTPFKFPLTARFKIDVVVYYLTGKSEPQSWQTRGWFSLDPGQKKHVADSHNRYE